MLRITRTSKSPTPDPFNPPLLLLQSTQSSSLYCLLSLSVSCYGSGVIKLLTSIDCLHLDIPLSNFMQSNSTDHHHGFSTRDSLEPGPSSRDPNPPTLAPFAPPSFSGSRSGYHVAQKSPLLVATPPQITRALSQSHPYVRAGNKFLGLLTWTSGDPWESFLLVAAFWAAMLYGEVVLQYIGPLVVVLGLAAAVFLWRFKNSA